MFKNSKKQGDMGMGSAIAYFTKQGYTVSIPLTDSQDYDLIVDDGSLKKVQVKTAAGDEIDLRTSGGNKSRWSAKKFDPASVDMIFAVTGLGTYNIPTTGLKNQSTLTICDKYKPFLIT